MKRYIALIALAYLQAQAATINWSAGIDHGFSLADGTNLATGSLVRLGHFRDPVTSAPLTDAQIQAAAGDVNLLAARFVSVGSSTIGNGLSGIAAHFSASSAADTAALGLVGKQMYLWVLNAPTINAATQQAILYWDITNATNPDGAPIRPQLRWAFPAQQPVPGNTSIDLTDLTSGSAALGTGAKVVVGSFPTGNSTNTAAPNFGLMPISNSLVINTSPVLATAVRSSNYSQTLVATGGSDPLTWTVSSGALPDGLTLGETTGTISGIPTTVGQVSFTVQVADSGALLASKQFSLEVAAAALAIVTPANLVDGLLDQPYQIMLHSDGGSTPHAWAHTSGSLPPGLILGADGDLSGTLTALGTFNFEATVSDTTGQQVARGFTLNVTHTPSIVGASSLVPGVLGLAYSHPFIITDTLRPYTWTVTAGSLPAGLVLTSAGVLRGKPTTAGDSTFTVRALGAGGVSSSRQFTLTILATNAAPTLQVPVFPETIVGNASFRHRVISSPNPSTIKASGLPPGLTLDPATGWITGNPTRAGVFVMTLQARNAAGSSAVEYAVIRVKALPVGAVGTFVAQVAPVQEVNLLLGGRLDLTTTLAGAYTLTLTQGSAVLKTKGVLTTDVANQNPRVITTIGNLRINLILDTPNNTLTGTIAVVSAAGTPIPAAVTGWRQTWSSIVSSDRLAGFYTTGLELSGFTDIETVPQGTGVVWVNVSHLGTTQVSGRTATGQTITTSGILSADGRVLLHSRLDKNLGIIQGTLQVTPAANITDNTLTGSVQWRKSNSITTTYPSAFGPVTLNASGGWMGNTNIVKVAVGGRILGLPVDGSPCAITFTKGGIAGTATSPNIDPFTFTHYVIKDPAIRANLPLAGSSSNQTRLSMAMSAQLGVFSGTFELLDSGKRRPATYYGTIVRTPSASLKGVGHFLLPKLPQVGQAGKPEVLSGKVTITQP